MKPLKFKLTMAAGTMLGLMTMSGMGMGGAVMAAPILTIVDAANNPASNPAHKEVTGDPGGTNYGVGYGTFNGPGLPSAGAGWPGGPGFAPDPSFGGSMGTTGWHASYLNVSKDADVTFQFMGKGDATSTNHFYVDATDDNIVNYVELFRGGVTTSCAMFGGTTPSCDKKNVAGGNEFTFSLKAGRISFAYMTGSGVLLENSGAGNGNPDTAPGQLPGYFLGVDPYQAAGQYQTSGSSVYAGLTDAPAASDHDFQDMGVRISVVPEPSGIALAFAGLAGLAYSRRCISGNKKKA
ncbi:PEP-CTERM sorting domain-containing protein [Paucibacter sp. B2R-40]|uniref:PEP-CTERM sorting domain-containing protein n=1 Tax=Paucibacter sp. B2R-40 TaxID=2893554 RepID=UPI0021E3C9EE|nr:PEP-CTERM sorting domain-containing protein [Paucibacter sp. B2R-40]MCV2355622.1 PEP-CTERM sorting domain-containing protein [Paucibacter sp. B2R-40]